MRKCWLAALIAIGICSGIGYGIYSNQPAPYLPTQAGDPLLPVQTLQQQSFTYTQNFVGSIQAIQSVAVVPYAAGFLKEIRVQTGTPVTAGDILFLMDDRIPMARLKQAKEAVDEAYATRENALAYYQRMQHTESKAISPTELEQAETEFKAADAAYQKALAAQNQAQTLYDYTIIRAPVSGWLGNITATTGEYLSPEGKTLATVIGFSPIRLTFSVPPADQASNFNNARLQVILANNTTFEPDSFQVTPDNHADQSTGALSFFIDVNNPDKRLIPGSYIEVNFLYPETGILVDKNWISLTPDGAKAFLLINGKVEKRSVRIKAPIDHQYWIESGLSPGDTLITVPVSADQIGQPAQGVSR